MGKVPLELWMDEILHHLRNPGMLPTNYSFPLVQDFVHPR